jgi:N-acetylmuramoyl-L-alanine amidase
MEQFSTKNGKPTVPAVLTENFFYSNADDCKYLCSKKGKEDIVKLHF